MPTAALPDSIKRVGKTDAFPNEYPGQVYAFNWCLNGDGVTPLRKSAFRITKPLDLKVAGLSPAKQPLKVSNKKWTLRRYFLESKPIYLCLGVGQSRGRHENARSRFRKAHV